MEMLGAVMRCDMRCLVGLRDAERTRALYQTLKHSISPAKLKFSQLNYTGDGKTILDERKNTVFLVKTIYE